MTAAQMGVYITLIALMYERAGPIQCDDTARLARLCGTSASAFALLLDSLISDGKITREGNTISNHRAMLEIENVMAKSKVARDKAEARWTKKQTKSIDASCCGNAVAMLANSQESDISSLRSDILRNSADHDENPKPEKPSRKPAIARPENVPEGLWNDFVAHRKAKRAPITQTVLDGFAREARTAGVTLQDAIRLSVERNWQGFKAEWMNDRKPQQAPQKTGSAGMIEALRKIRDETSPPDDFREPRSPLGYLADRK